MSLRRGKCARLEATGWTVAATSRRQAALASRSPMNNPCFGPSRLTNLQVSDLRLIAKPSFSAAS